MQTGRWCAMLSRAAAALALVGSLACGSSDSDGQQDQPKREFGPVDQPIPPDGFLSDLPPEQRQRELARIAAGTPLEELPSDEREGIEAANKNEQRREPLRHSLHEMAKSQAARAGSPHGADAAGEPHK